MIDLLYEKQGSYLQGREEERIENAKGMLAYGDSVEKIVQITKLSEKNVLQLKAEVEKEQRMAK